MSVFWHIDGAEGLTAGSSSNNIGRYFGTARTAGVAGATYGGVTLPTSRHGFGQMYAAAGGALQVQVPSGLRAINLAASLYSTTGTILIGLGLGGAIGGPTITYTSGVLYANGLNASETSIGSWNNASWVHVEIDFYYEDINESGNGSGYARFYVNGALMHSRTYDSSGINLVDILSIQNARIDGRVSDDYVIRGSSISAWQSQIGDVRVETFINGTLSVADGDTTSALTSSGSESSYGVTISPVGSVSGNYRAIVAEAIARKEDAGDALYVKPRLVGITSYGNEFGEAAGGSYTTYSAAAENTTASGAQTVGILASTTP
jgi:hypothetical protein